MGLRCNSGFKEFGGFRVYGVGVSRIRALGVGRLRALCGSFRSLPPQGEQPHCAL